MLEHVVRRLVRQRRIDDLAGDRIDDRRISDDRDAREGWVRRKLVGDEALSERIEQVEARESGKQRAARAYERSEIKVRVVSDREIVPSSQVFVREIGAHEPVEAVIPGISLKPQLLAERLELVRKAAVVVAIEDVEVVEVRVLAADIFVEAIGGQRGELVREA